MYFSENSKNSANLVPYNHETKWLLPKIQILEDYGETIRSMAFLHALKEQPLIVIPFHGVVSVGSTMEECLSQLELLESLAQFRLLKGE